MRRIARTYSLSLQESQVILPYLVALTFALYMRVVFDAEPDSQG